MNTLMLLKKWRGYQENIEQLEYFGALEPLNAKVLFHSLASLTENERIYLAKKYVEDTSKFANNYLLYIPQQDKYVAEKLGVSLSVYQEKRTRIEQRLHRLLEESLDEIRRSMYIDYTYVLALDHLFYVEETAEGVVSCTQDIQRATIFHIEDPGCITKHLEYFYGFTRKDPVNNER
ncbi:MAG: hypothetical protein ACK5NA_02065 [Enterococcus sp.]